MPRDKKRKIDILDDKLSLGVIEYMNRKAAKDATVTRLREQLAHILRVVGDTVDDVDDIEEFDAHCSLQAAVEAFRAGSSPEGPKQAVKYYADLARDEKKAGLLVACLSALHMLEALAA